ncbi:MAG: bifunctional pyr operon transcriptional regulator/uracil phosphoribosyltransferase, partial [Clostridia bacterium]|nr:bifunctional pyr operon transcriptional regulator/uracil phosphoribosyltransferase [Clostridia bacterium]
MKLKSRLMDEDAMRRALMRISHEITEKNKGVHNVCIVGILRRGERLAEIVRDNIEKIEGVQVPCGSIDINFYRDDLSPVAEAPVIGQAQLPFEVTGKT